MRTPHHPDGGSGEAGSPLDGAQAARCFPLCAKRPEPPDVLTTHWEPARLIPATGISGSDDQEVRAASVLLAEMAVPRSPDSSRALAVNSAGR